MPYVALVESKVESVCDQAKSDEWARCKKKREFDNCRRAPTPRAEYPTRGPVEIGKTTNNEPPEKDKLVHSPNSKQQLERTNKR